MGRSQAEMFFKRLCEPNAPKINKKSKVPKVPKEPRIPTGGKPLTREAKDKKNAQKREAYQRLKTSGNASSVSRKNYERRKNNYITKYGEDAWREYQRIRRKKYVERNRESVNIFQRDFYQKRKNSESRKQNERRIRREPWRGLETLSRKVGKGNIPISELANVINERLQHYAAKDIRKNNQPGVSDSKHLGCSRRKDPRRINNDADEGKK